jgi:hypothetical protein
MVVRVFSKYKMVSMASKIKIADRKMRPHRSMMSRIMEGVLRRFRKSGGEGTKKKPPSIIWREAIPKTDFKV